MNSVLNSYFFLVFHSRSEPSSQSNHHGQQQSSFNGKVHNNKRFAFGVLDNEGETGRDKGLGRQDNGGELDDDRQALLPKNKTSDNNDGRRLSRDELNEVSIQYSQRGQRRVGSKLS